MNLSSDRVSRACVTAQAVLGKLTLGVPGDGSHVVSVEELQDVVGKMSGVSITKEQALFKGEILRGKIERWDSGKSAKIYIRYDQTEDWKRFVTAKELLHILVDDERDFSPYGDQTLEELVLAGHFGWINIAGALSNGYVQSEIVAEIAALEVLYPIQFRRNDIRTLAEGLTNNIELSARYWIPRNYISTAVNPRYLDLQIKALEDNFPEVAKSVKD